MKRGEIWVAAGPGDYSRKPRPVVIIQDDAFDATQSITVCAFTTSPVTSTVRVEVQPSESNGLSTASRLMVDKIATMKRAKLHSQIGVLGQNDIVRLNRAIAVFLGLAAGSRSASPSVT